MIDRVLMTIEKNNMVSPGDNITVALSGGADSVALLCILCSLRDRLGITVSAAHLNHMLRGDEADRDEQFAKSLCEHLGIEFVSERIDVPAISAESGESFELAARRVRYDFLERVSPQKIATAHTASDNAETVLFNIIRGCGIKGVSGIPAVRGRFIRPLIDCTRADIEKYCSDNSLQFVTDSTNLTDDCSRNVLRHRAVPVMRELNPSFDSSVRRLSTLALQDCDFLDNYADEIFEKSVIRKNNSIVIDDVCHEAIASRLVRRLCCEVSGQTAENQHVERILDSLGNKTKISLPGGVYADINGRMVRIYRDAFVSAPDFKVNICKISRKNLDLQLKVNKLLLKNAVDCDKIVGRLTLRTREEGDSVKIFGRNGTKSLKKLYNEEKIPVFMRSFIPVAADSDGVVWIYGIGVSQRACVDGGTKNVCVFETECKGL